MRARLANSESSANLSRSGAIEIGNIDAVHACVWTLLQVRKL